jgi:transposase
MEVHALGIDLGKTLFHLLGVDSSGSVVVRKWCSRNQLLAFTANLRVQRIGMEACSGSHFLGRALRDQGHDLRLIPAQYVKPYVKTNKSDSIDAEGLPKRCSGRACVSCRSKPRISSICKPYIRCGIHSSPIAFGRLKTLVSHT